MSSKYCIFEVSLKNRANNCRIRIADYQLFTNFAAEMVP